MGVTAKNGKLCFPIYAYFNKYLLSKLNCHTKHVIVRQSRLIKAFHNCLKILDNEVYQDFK